ncbi:MAG: hypothetical protein K2P68_12360 [Sphingomonas sp.]|nr:hypothetical protein [Sphingomonas sp.]
MHRIVTPALLILLPLSFFLAFFHWETLQVDNPGWLLRGTDNGENALGSHAYWHDPAAGMSLRTTMLDAPDGVPVLYTDSNPLVTLLAKPLAKMLPVDAQLVGSIILINLIFQAFFAWLLLRRHAPGPVALWAGVVLLAFPPTLANRFMHVNLMAHWMILAALYLFLDDRRAGQLRWWAPLITVCALVHSYLLVMIGAIWASAMLVRFVKGDTRDRILTIGQSISVLTLVVLLAKWLGVGDQKSTGTFGNFAMPLDALWNPHNSNFSTLVPAHHDYGGLWFEGFQYLGAGGLALVAAAIIIGWSLPIRDGERAVGRRLWGMVPALTVLSLLATLQVSLPPMVMAVLDLVRASGRLFWPVGYVLVMMSVLTVYRLSTERAGLALVAMIALQVVDLSGMAATIRMQSQEAVRHRLYARTTDPRWDQLVTRAKSVTFMPDDVPRDLGIFQEVAWRAIKAGRPVANVYAARPSGAAIARHSAEAAAFERGELVPGRLYVMLKGSAVAPAALRAAGARVMTLDGRTIIAP